MGRYGYALAVIVLLAVLLCGPPLTRTARAEWVAVATMAEGVTQERVPTRSVYVLPPTVPEVYCAWMLLGAKAGDQITGTFVVVDVGDVAPPNYVIDTGISKIPPSQSDTAWEHFKLSRPSNGWPLGSYQVERRKNGVLVAVASFVIGKSR